MLLIALLSHIHVRPEIVLALDFFYPLGLTVTIVNALLVPLDKLNLLSNFGSYSMASLG